MSSGRRWTIEITWLDDKENEATTSYHSDERDTDLVHFVATSVSKLCKSTYNATIIDTYVKMFCLDCDYDSEKESSIACSYICSCNKKKDY
jgi:hypothetical protein